MSLPAGPKTKITANIPPATDPIDMAENVLGISLYEWQESVITDCHQNRYKLAFAQVGRRNGKSFLAAVLAIWELCYEQTDRHIYVVSDSERNLNSVLMRQIRLLIDKSPLADCLHQFKSHIECPATRSFLQAVPGNFAASQGKSPDLLVGDEIHLWSEEVFAGWQMTGANNPEFMFVAITTPGYNLDASPAYALYTRAKNGDTSFYSKIYEPQDPDCEYDDQQALRDANPAIANNPALLDGLLFNRDQVPENDWKRFHLGLWTVSKTAFLPRDAWQNCYDPNLPATPPEGTRGYIGLDGAFSLDSTALTFCSEAGELYVLGCWENPGNKNWRVPRREVHDAVDLAFRDLDVVMMLADPPYWASEISEWQQKYGLKKVVEFPTYVRARIAPATQQFKMAVLQKNLSHNGDKRLARHIQNCSVKSSIAGDYVCKEEGNHLAKIDLAVSAILAASQATLAKKKKKPLYIGKPL